MRTFPSSNAVTMQVLQHLEAAGVREPCDLDLLLFFARHPRVVLSSDQLGTYIGYDGAQVARALDLFLAVGVLNRRPNQRGAGQLYVLAVDAGGEWLQSVRRLCATPEGRNALRTLLKERRAQTHAMNGSAEHA